MFGVVSPGRVLPTKAAILPSTGLDGRSSLSIRANECTTDTWLSSLNTTRYASDLRPGLRVMMVTAMCAREENSNLSILRVAAAKLIYSPLVRAFAEELWRDGDDGEDETAGDSNDDEDGPISVDSSDDEDDAEYDGARQQSGGGSTSHKRNKKTVNHRHSESAQHSPESNRGQPPVEAKAVDEESSTASGQPSSSDGDSSSSGKDDSSSDSDSSIDSDSGNDSGSSNDSDSSNSVAPIAKKIKRKSKRPTLITPPPTSIQIFQMGD